jgi:hypothetical protein
MGGLVALCLLAAGPIALPAPALAQQQAAEAEGVTDGGRSAGRREFSTDRPDKTESPFTVDAGRFQVELGVGSYSWDEEQFVSTEEAALGAVNLRYGIGRDTDLHLIVEPYRRRRVTDHRAQTRDTTDGFGDVTVRLKHNLWGNDGGSTALAILPFVTLPTSSADLGSGRVEFGLIVPLAIQLSDKIELGVMTEADLVENDAAQGYRLNVINSASAAFALTDRLGAYGELFTERGEEWIVTGDVGLTYATSEETQIDVGANLGLTRAADDLEVFVGLSRRF